MFQMSLGRCGWKINRSRSRSRSAFYDKRQPQLGVWSFPAGFCPDVSPYSNLPPSTTWHKNLTHRKHLKYFTFFSSYIFPNTGKEQSNFAVLNYVRPHFLVGLYFVVLGENSVFTFKIENPTSLSRKNMWKVRTKKDLGFGENHSDVWEVIYYQYRYPVARTISTCNPRLRNCDEDIFHAYIINRIFLHKVCTQKRRLVSFIPKEIPNRSKKIKLRTWYKGTVSIAK